MNTTYDRSTLIARPEKTRLLWLGTALMLVLTVLCLGLSSVDDRTLRDVNVWTKPIKFHLSLAMYFATLALIIPLLQASIRHSVWFRGVVVAGVVAGLGEIAWITFQATGGRASHFNLETQLEPFAYQLIGLGAVTLVTVSACVGLAVLLRPILAVPNAVRLGSG